MQVSIWNDYLTKLDKKIRLQNYHILLFANNASMHIIDENVNLTNITVYFLPPNTTVYLQPYDMRIINSFKVSNSFFIFFLI